ncbi:ATP-binding cassette domain-containing protein [Paenibacillus albicereus]|uniref:ATP-binding cassette domain-containing protein n=1 Tax=Paenibacillus albicereus TaxID=2726185 RepID=A0A6H2H1R1_9BACL|nr:ATP-binding cassette domain-containing protein [Paenibacillus albicereus]QJC53610.1 ATP-binding cassette domain-containing protein [Paenibacillus albicereus]
MASYQIEDVSFRYAGSAEPKLEGVSLSIREGEFVLLCGPSGSGKTTLLRQLKREAAPAGERTGVIRYAGEPLEALSESRSAEEIGMVFQDPDSQIVMSTAWQELTFAMENLGYPAAAIQRRLAELVPFFGIESWLHRAPSELSGGQKQLLSLASVMTLRPRVLLLDEPTAQLDPVAAREFIGLIARLNEELGLTVVLSEHRYEDLFPLASRVVLLREGRVAVDAPPREAARAIWREGRLESARLLPAVARLCLDAEPLEPAVADVPLTVREGRAWLRGALERLGPELGRGRSGERGGEREAPALASPGLAGKRAGSGGEAVSAAGQPAPESAATVAPEGFGASASAGTVASLGSGASASAATVALASAAPSGRSASAPPAERPLLECRDLVFAYAKDEPLVLSRLSLEVRRGEWMALLGSNGAGKSTLLQCIAGALEPQRGRILLGGEPLASGSSLRRLLLRRKGSGEPQPQRGLAGPDARPEGGSGGGARSAAAASQGPGSPEAGRREDREPRLRGAAALRGRIGYVAQNPLLYFTRDTVGAQLEDRLRRLGLKEAASPLAELEALLELEGLRDKHPYDISGGQQQKLALLLVLLGQPELLLLDEPTKGLDPESKHRLAGLLGDIRERGATLLMVTHDVEFAAAYADRCGLLFDGRMAGLQPTRAFMSDNYYYTTSVRRAAGELLPELLTLGDLGHA